MEKCFACRDVMSNILSYLHIDDWYACHTLSSKMALFVNRMYSFIEKWTKERLIQLLTSIFEKEDLVSDFLNLLHECHGFITGSIFLELLIGTSAETRNKPFQANDIDIFLPWKVGYTPLHRFLWCMATGTKSIPGKKLTLEESMHASTFVIPTGFETQILPHATLNLVRSVPFYHQEEIIRYIAHDKIVNVTEYKIGKLVPEKMQLVEINNVDVQKFIHTAFDFQCVMGYYNGNTLKLPNLADVWNRKLVISPIRQQYVGFMSPFAVRNYEEKRIQKYKDRGFTLGHDLSCLGKYWERLHELKLREGRLYTLPHLIRLCETGQRQVLKRSCLSRYPPTQNIRKRRKN